MKRSSMRSECIPAVIHFAEKASQTIVGKRDIELMTAWFIAQARCSVFQDRSFECFCVGRFELVQNSDCKHSNIQEIEAGLFANYIVLFNRMLRKPTTTWRSPSA